MPSERIPTSQAARAARVGRLAATEAVRHAGTHAANIARPRPARRAALERRHLETADQILTVLGTMKGAAMKIGQMLSFVDLGVVPHHARPEFQRKLAALRDAAPKVSFERMMRVLEEELGKPPSEVFSERFDAEPIGVASIGQVYRAALKHDGREVAVKIQYPGMAAAVRADMKNLTLLMRLIKRAMPGIDTDALAREIRLRIGEELDYELEAANQHAFAERIRRASVRRRPGCDPAAVWEAGAGLELCRGHQVRTAEVGSGRHPKQGRRDHLPLLLRHALPAPRILG